jgi:hypothetical protein
MARPGIAEILRKISELPTPQERQDALGFGASNQVLVGTLRLIFDPSIEFVLPPGEPPYTPATALDLESSYYQAFNRMYLFVKGGNDNLHKLKREALFVQMLESVTPEDAKMIIAMKDKKSLWKNITYELVYNTFPGLLPPPEEAAKMFKQVEEVEKKEAKKTNYKLSAEDLERACPFGCVSVGGKAFYGKGPLMIHLKSKHAYTPEQIEAFKAENY